MLLDLKQLLMEAKQRIPPYLEQLESEVEQYQVIGGIRGCAYCGGLGHRITDVCAVYHVCARLVFSMLFGLSGNYACRAVSWSCPLVLTVCSFPMQCPKLQGDQTRNVGFTKRDILSGGGEW